mmetsp:Transcript_23144/g.54726  ORF Transcript_23144/g.54726 Transcript_23144/m.54726 type:complete len:1005 (-) Transcript_23144:186-3200(-)|eukprot:CAMPEP_0197189816 /NCGR_PEP_ID=MMETSP1423-20130617/20435_1 /TAXON_ID=476441 /ORGANISM="Pseudo-nitzschia heimii, Strain UNC1101" /LENGTH=1004 /DNA_ID=CAMNT_0042642035 /DNA_START=53 /DNA_END=3067 /DNA_ORIENTATION=-
MGKSVPRRRGRSKGEDKAVSAKSPLNFPKFNQPLIQWSGDESTWYDYGKDIPGRNDILSSTSSTSSELIRHYRSMADSIFANELRLFRESQNKNSKSDEQWVENTMRKGTLKDRIAAMSVTLSTDPLHKFYALDGLMSLVGCSSASVDGGRTNSRVAQLTAEALEDLFINSLLPPDRKLLTLAQRPLCQYESGNKTIDSSTTNGKKKKASNGSKSLSPRILLLWRFEEMIKEKYDLYLHQYMAKTLQDGAELQKIATLRSAGNLLTSIPEGEVQLLNMMVNKLGDPEKKTAAAAGHQLRLVLREHSNMQNVIAREVQQLAHRPHLAPKALYNCIVFLNQLQLKRVDPISSVDDNGKNHSFEAYSLPASLIKTYFRLFEVAVQQNKKKSSSKGEDGGSMKSRLLSALLTGVNRAHPYLPEEDQDMEEHVDALYRIVHTSPPAACTQALMLLFHLAVGSRVEEEEEGNQRMDNEDVGERLRQKDRFYRALYATLSKSSIISSGKHLTMYFNVLYKAMKYDTNVKRVHSFAKRLLIATIHTPAPLIAASVYLLQEISAKHVELRESWEDIPDPESSSWLVLDDQKREPKASIVHFKELDCNRQEKKDSFSDGSQGNPPCWEMSLLAHHFHPSVSKFVNDIGEIEYGGDPLQDFGLAPFLDKFAYRNPKSREKLEQQRQLFSGSGAGSRKAGKIEMKLGLPVNDPSFLKETDVNEQDEFFHQFFMERARRDELKGIIRHKANGSDNEDSDDDKIRKTAEDEAFDVAEDSIGLGVGGKTFEEYEAMWETDDEEEAFVDSLAMSLMEDAAGGPADIDEDPVDIDDWGKLYEDESDENEKANESDSDEEKNEREKPSKLPKKIHDKNFDDDAFMEDANSSSVEPDSDSSSKEPEIDEDEFVAGMGVETFANADDDDDTDDYGVFIDDESDGGDTNEIVETKSSKKRKKGNEVSDQPVFVDAEEYEKVITKSFNELKNARNDDVKTIKNENKTDDSKSSKKKESKSRKKRKN